MLLERHNQTCTDPGIFVRGGPGQADKKALTTFFFFFFFFFFFQSSAYFTEVKWSISKKSITFQGSRGGPTFSRGEGVQIFPGGGVQLLIPYKNPYTCDFPGGGSGPPVPPSGSALVRTPIQDLHCLPRCKDKEFKHYYEQMKASVSITLKSELIRILFKLSISVLIGN